MQWMDWGKYDTVMMPVPIDLVKQIAEYGHSLYLPIYGGKQPYVTPGTTFTRACKEVAANMTPPAPMLEGINSFDDLFEEG